MPAISDGGGCVMVGVAVGHRSPGPSGGGWWSHGSGLTEEREVCCH